MTSQKKIIAVFGATGAQGGGVARAILSDPDGEFSVRAITRDPGSAKAMELSNLGAEVVRGDIDDPESVRQALKGAYGAYCVTFFWDHFSPEKEKQEAKIMAEAAKGEGLQHVIWSTLEDVREYFPLDDDRMPTLQGSYKVPHFDGKGESNKFFIDAGVPVTFLLTAFYWDNFIHFGLGPQNDGNGNLVISFPLGDKKMASIAADDIGKCAYGIFKKGTGLVGQTVGIAAEFLSGEEMARKMSEAIGKPIAYREVSPEAYRSLGFPGADDLGNMFQFYRDREDVFLKSRDVKFARELNPSLKTFDQWLAENGAKIPVE